MPESDYALQYWRNNGKPSIENFPNTEHKKEIEATINNMKKALLRSNKKT